jgi:hypothetical protein
MSLLAFLRHAAIAGQGPGTGFLPTVTRGIGLLLFYERYIHLGPGVNLVGFSLPAIHDPTEKGDFSTIAGKAFADFLAKGILGATFTFTYEAALANLGLPITGHRPDFLCTLPNGQFSLESKGLGTPSVGPQVIDEAKTQAGSGAIQVQYSYASITYDLYGEPRCHLRDPTAGEVPAPRKPHRQLARAYYKEIIRDLSDHKQTATERVAEREFSSYPFQSLWGPLRFLVDRDVEARIRESDKVLRGFEPISDERYYVDRDGIGISRG